jgi:hypothetical protein
MICESADDGHREGRTFIMSVFDSALSCVPWTVWHFECVAHLSATRVLEPFSAPLVVLLSVYW